MCLVDNKVSSSLGLETYQTLCDPQLSFTAYTMICFQHEKGVSVNNEAISNFCDNVPLMKYHQTYPIYYIYLTQFVCDD